MKIYATNKDESVILEVSFMAGFADEWTYNFTFRVGDESYAGIIAKEISRQLRSEMEAIREQAYNQGWDDHKKRRRKKSYFDGFCGSTNSCGR